jgi:hypothetical protein
VPLHPGASSYDPRHYDMALISVSISIAFMTTAGRGGSHVTNTIATAEAQWRFLDQRSPALPRKRRLPESAEGCATSWRGRPAFGRHLGASGQFQNPTCYGLTIRKDPADAR